MCGLVFVFNSSYSSEDSEGLSFENLFSVSIVSIPYLAGQGLIVGARYGSTVVAVSIVTATFLLKILSLVRSLKCLLLNRSFNSVINFPWQRSDGAGQPLSFPNLSIALRIYLTIPVGVRRKEFFSAKSN